MSAMIEAVARAICKANGHNPDDLVLIAGDSPRYWQTHVDYARAAIEAMREPTPEMYGAGGVAQFAADAALTPVREAVGNVWRAMVGAALSERPICEAKE